MKKLLHLLLALTAGLGLTNLMRAQGTLFPYSGQLDDGGGSSSGGSYAVSSTIGTTGGGATASGGSFSVTSSPWNVAVVETPGVRQSSATLRRAVG